MCVCVTRESFVSALITKGEEGGEASHPLCPFRHQLLTNLLSSRHSQDLNDPQAAESIGTHPAPEEKSLLTFMRFVCVCLPTESPSALSLANLCLVNPPRGPSLGKFCFLWSHCSLYTHTHTHKCTYTHSKSCVSVYLDVIVCNLIQ